MKVQIDFDNKIIRLETDVNLRDFYIKIKEVLGKEWLNYKLETNTVINWTTYPNTLWIGPYKPWWETPPVVYCNATGTHNITL